ncbi:MAG TPA: DUF6152 family protein [Gammaproteobacteria bacterium]|jgi:hypothetical protein
MSFRTFLWRLGPAALLAMAVTAMPVAAHHANSAYDRSQTVTVTGIVTRWQFINPHAGIWLDVTDEQGNVTEWSGEFQSVQDLYRFFSWNKDTFQAGDRITIIGNPDRRADRYSMWTSKVVFADGTEVDVRNTPD